MLTRFLISSNVHDGVVCGDGEYDNDIANAAAANDPDVDANVAVGFGANCDGADEVANTPAGNNAADNGDDPDVDPDVDVAAGFDDDGKSADVDADAPANNITADDGCDEDDGNGEGEINDCNRAES